MRGGGEGTWIVKDIDGMWRCILSCLFSMAGTWNDLETGKYGETSTVSALTNGGDLLMHPSVCAKYDVEQHSACSWHDPSMALMMACVEGVGFNGRWGEIVYQRYMDAFLGSLTRNKAPISSVDPRILFFSLVSVARSFGSAC